MATSTFPLFYCKTYSKVLQQIRRKAKGQACLTKFSRSAACAVEDANLSVAVITGAGT
jgi:hypothetical protein